jgi:hypothetical protein
VELIEIPEDHSSETPIEELIARQMAVFRQAKARFTRFGPRQVKLPGGPYAIAHFGDPHVDDDGCDWPALMRAIEIINKTEGMYAANGGDSSNRWVGFLQKKYGEQTATTADEDRLVEWLIGSTRWLYMLLGNHDCLTPAAECLTKRGWVTYDQILDDDEVLQLNPETGISEWGPILGKVVREHDGEVVQIRSRSIDITMTPNHRVLHQRASGKGPFKFSPASELPARFMLPVSGITDRPDYPGVTDDQLELFGWFLTDGRKGVKGYWRIYQSRPRGVKKIEALIERMGLTPKHVIRQREQRMLLGRMMKKPPLPAHEWKFRAEESREITKLLPERGKLPDWVNHLSARQFQILLDAMMDGDGTWRGYAHDTAVIHKDYGFLSSVQAAASQHGWRARIAWARNRQEPRLNLHKAPTVTVAPEQVSTSHYTGPVWCLTVQHGNFFVRENGKAHFTGNCWRDGASLLTRMSEKTDVAMIAPDDIRLEILSPDGAPCRIHARHDFPGNSMWNPAHAPMRASKLDGWGDIYIAFHRHIWVDHREECADGRVRWALRARGFKRFDDYARSKGFPEQQHGEILVTVHDPANQHPGERVRVHLDVEEAAETLTWLRKRRGY